MIAIEDTRREARRAASLRWYHKNKDKAQARYLEIKSALAMLKLEAGCADCGYDKDPVALDFDHLYDKSFSVSRVSGRNLDLILDEVDKCEVVCANCHRIRSLP